MPINVGNNLTLKNTDISGTYGELFKKLNKAYAWSHNVSTSSGGTAVILVNNGDILTTMECNDIDKCYCQQNYQNWDSWSVIYAFIVDGHLYRYNGSTASQVGTKTNWKITNNLYSIDEDGYLYYTKEGNETKIGESNKWTNLSTYGTATVSNPATVLGICDGYLYQLKGTEITQVGENNKWEYVTGIPYTSNNNNPYGICDGYLYKISSVSSQTLMNENNGWIYIYTYCSNGSYSTCGLRLNGNNREIYSLSTSTPYVSLLKTVNNTVEKVEIDYDGYYTYIEDNKLYNSRYSKFIGEGINWTDFSVSRKKLLAIGDGKLYYIDISNSSQPTFTQIGTESNYQKLWKCGYNSTGILGLAWTGDATSVTHTIFTTKEPQVGDIEYIDEDLNQYSTILSVGGTTVSDQYRTYTRDVTRDSSFTAIPPATIRETVSTVDFLRITNPNT